MGALAHLAGRQPGPCQRELEVDINRLFAETGGPLGDLPLLFEGDGPKRRQADDVEHFKAVAAVYQAAMATPGRKRPTVAVKDHFGVSHSTATKWVHHARDELHLLPPTTPGKPAATHKATKAPRKGKR